MFKSPGTAGGFLCYSHSERTILLNGKNTFFDILNAAGQLVVVSLLWSFCCIPVFTIGPASMALYYAVVKVIRRDRSNILEAFFHAFKTNFWQSTNWNLILLTYYGVVALCAVLRIRAVGGFVLDTVMGGIFALAFLAAWMLPYVYPVISRFFHRGFALFRFVLYIAIRHFGVTVISLLLLAGSLLLCLYHSASLIFVPGLFALIQSYMLEPIFKSMSADDGSDSYNEWYGDMGEEKWSEQLAKKFAKKKADKEA